MKKVRLFPRKEERELKKRIRNFKEAFVYGHGGVFIRAVGNGFFL